MSMVQQEIGKTSFCRYIAQTLFGAFDTLYFSIGNDERVSFYGYDGESVIIWNDFRVTDFIQQFKPNVTYNILIHIQIKKHSKLNIPERFLRML